MVEASTLFSAWWMTPLLLRIGRAALLRRCNAGFARRVRTALLGLVERCAEMTYCMISMALAILSTWLTPVP
jgi:hypothetical protein